jgi:hypothetical protein
MIITGAMPTQHFSGVSHHRRRSQMLITTLPEPWGVGFQKSVAHGEQWLHATRSYSLIKPCRTGRRLIRS